MKSKTIFLALAGLLALALSAAAPAALADQGYAVKGKVTLLELGAPTCPPCRAMAPILEELSREYSAKLEVVKVDVNRDPGVAMRFGIRMIPTQIYFDTKGREAYRHFGYMSKSGIRAVLTSLGVY
jgi:thioredoxin 1